MRLSHRHDEPSRITIRHISVEKRKVKQLATAAQLSLQRNVSMFLKKGPLPVSDVAYVWLAKSKKAKLLTLDERLGDVFQ